MYKFGDCIFMVDVFTLGGDYRYQTPPPPVKLNMVFLNKVDIKLNIERTIQK